MSAFTRSASCAVVTVEVVNALRVAVPSGTPHPVDFCTVTPLTCTENT